jgi:hypothetical protein
MPERSSVKFASNSQVQSSLSLFTDLMVYIA